MPSTALRRLIAPLVAAAVLTAVPADAQEPATGGRAAVERPDAAAPAVPGVLEVQRALNALGYDAGPEDGKMGPRTEAAIRAFQADEGLPQSGEVTAELGRAIAAVHFRDSPEAAALWRKAARYLEALGYPPGDGGFAEPTARAALEAFQAEHGRAPTGRFSRAVYRAIERSAENDPAVRRRLCLELYRQRDYAAAAGWCRRAALAGDVEAQVWIGHLRYYGLGGERDYAAAARWYRMAAEQGDARARTYLGVMYSEGLGVPRNDVAAQRWFEMATE